MTADINEFPRGGQLKTAGRASCRVMRRWSAQLLLGAFCEGVEKKRG
jgi:hypothetical protein